MTVTCAMPTIPARTLFRSFAERTAMAQVWGPVEVKYGHGPNPWTARNRAVEQVTTPWTAFLDDDDWWYPDHVGTLLDAQETSGADLVYPDCFELHEGNLTRRSIGAFDEDRLRAGNYIPVTYLIRTEIAQRLKFPPRKKDSPSDWLFLLKCLDAGVKFHHVPAATWVWRRWEGNSWSWR